MGSDIYWFVEEFDDEENSWRLIDGSIPFPAVHTSPLLYGGRNYELFGLLGWHGRRTADALPTRGLPDDANPITRASAEVVGEDAQDHSWATLAELVELVEPKTEDPRLREVIDGIEKRVHDREDARIVYWFDQ